MNSCHVFPVLAPSKGQESTHVRYVLKTLQERYQIEKFTIGWVTDPALYWYSIVCRDIVSTALASSFGMRGKWHTLVKHVAHGAVIQYHDLAEIGFHRA
jgi:hypothetical protein